MSYEAVVPPELRGWFATVLSWFGVGAAAAELSVKSLEARIQLLRDQNVQLSKRIAELESEIKTLEASRRNSAVKQTTIADMKIEKKSAQKMIKSNLGHIGRARDAIRNQNDKSHLREINMNIQRLLASAPSVSIAQSRHIHSKVRSENSQLADVVQRSEDYEESSDTDILDDEYQDIQTENEEETTEVLTQSRRSQILNENFF